MTQLAFLHLLTLFLIIPICNGLVGQKINNVKFTSSSIVTTQLFCTQPNSNSNENQIIQPPTENMFLFTTCQVGSEKLLKADIISSYPDFKLAFSRPGLVTFKVPSTISHNLNIQSIFARSYGISAGNGKSSLDVINKAIQLRDSLSRNETQVNKQIRFRLHVWGRGEPFPSADHPDAIAAASTRVNSVTQELLDLGHQHNLWIDSTSESNMDSNDDGDDDAEEEYVFDVIVPTGPFIEESLFLGYHKHSRKLYDTDSGSTNIHTNRRSLWPGGDPRIVLPAEAPSRAYLKMEEAIAWSGAAIHSGQVAVEVGSAPGGASYALLQRGLTVVGIDPCPIDRQHDPIVANHPRFTHIKARLSDVSREQLPTHVDWLICDANLPPQVLLPQLTALMKKMEDTLLGVIITLKLFDTPAPTAGSRSSRPPLPSMNRTSSTTSSNSLSSNKKWSSSSKQTPATTTATTATAAVSVNVLDAGGVSNKQLQSSSSSSSASAADLTIINIKSLFATMSSPPPLTTTATHTTPVSLNTRRKPINKIPTDDNPRVYTRYTSGGINNNIRPNTNIDDTYMGLVDNTIKVTHLPSNRQEVCAFGLTRLGFDMFENMNKGNSDNNNHNHNDNSDSDNSNDSDKSTNASDNDNEIDRDSNNNNDNCNNTNNNSDNDNNNTNNNSDNDNIDVNNIDNSGDMYDWEKYL